MAIGRAKSNRLCHFAIVSFHSKVFFMPFRERPANTLLPLLISYVNIGEIDHLRAREFRWTGVEAIAATSSNAWSALSMHSPAIPGLKNH
jgi:hypothetical protein